MFKAGCIQGEKRFPESMQRSMTVSSEKGSSNWLSSLPISEYGFALHKSVFRDAICLHYGWIPKNLPTYCVCGKKLTTEHAFSCTCGGYPSICHNEIRDLTAMLLSEVCHNVGIEPHLQPCNPRAILFQYSFVSMLYSERARKKKKV